MRRQIGILIALICGGLGAYFGQPLVHDNSDVITILITVMTVFAGFLVAIIAVVGDPAMVSGKSWQAIELRRESIELSLIRHQLLFLFYLVAIGFLFVGALLNHEKAPPTTIGIWVERLYLFFGISSFFLTFGLPWTLLRLQKQRLDSETERRRREVGIVEDGTEPRD